MLASLVQKVELIWLAPLIATVLLHYLAEPSRWLIYLRKSHAVRWSPLFQIFSLAALIGYVMPARLGLPLRVVLLRQKVGLSVAYATALLSVDGLINYACWTAAALLGVLWFADRFPDVTGTVLYTAMVVACIGTTLAIVVAKSRNRQKSINATAGTQTLYQRLISLLFTLVTMIDDRVLFMSIAVSIMDIVGHVARHAILLHMIGHDISGPLVVAITVISVFAGIVSFMPMGLGGYDLTLIALLGLNGVPASDAVIVVLTNRLANLLVALPLGFSSGMFLGINAFSKKALSNLVSTTNKPTETV